ncbi:heterokaryon incompatibility protein-domain-containing protein, partial [Podospora fimiseda]
MPYARGQHDALSYTWGSPEKTSRIHLNHGDLAITLNFSAALSELRTTSEARFVWADVICINQDDIEERNRQIRMMQRIYRQASSVVVWLGDTTDLSTSTVRNLILPFNYSAESSSWPGTLILQFPEDILCGLRHLFSRPWWKRIWIVQEAVAAREIVFIYGGEVIPWRYLQYLCISIQLCEFRREQKTQALRTCGYRNFAALDNFRKHDPMPLLRLLQGTRNYEASDPRDKLYALLGMASDISSGDLIPDYSQSVEAIYRHLVRFM